MRPSPASLTVRRDGRPSLLVRTLGCTRPPRKRERYLKIIWPSAPSPARSPSGVGPMAPGGPRRRRARRRRAGSGPDGRAPGRPGEPASVRTGSRRLAAVRGRLRRRPVVFRPSLRPAGRRVDIPVRATRPRRRGRASDGPRRPVVRPRLPVPTRDAGLPVPRRPSELVQYLPAESTTPPHHELGLFALAAALWVADGRPGLPEARS